MFIRKTTIAAALVATASAQTAPTRFDKAPPNVSDALNARAKEFYQDHVTGKYRQAEALVAADSKDGFYAAEKPALLGFTFGDIVYSDHYTKAKVTVVGRMNMMFMGMGGAQIMDVPFPSYWRLEHGKWVWYIYKDPNRMTPFGRVTAKPSVAAAGTNPTDAFASAPDVNAILSGMKADKKGVTLPKPVGSKDTVTFVNGLAGKVTLSLDAASYPGLTVTLEPKELKQGEKATLTLARAEGKEYVNRVVRVTVQPSNQILDVLVSFQ